MNIYSKKQKWKLILFGIAVIIGITSLFYTNILVNKLAEEERKSVELWAEATRQFEQSDPNAELGFITSVMINNTTIPAMLVDGNDSIVFVRNLDAEKSLRDPSRLSNEEYQRNIKYLNKQLEIMKSENERIEINFSEEHHFIYYKDSVLLRLLYYYPFAQLAVIFLFILVSYYAFSSSRS